jgi:hypothetical protein
MYTLNKLIKYIPKIFLFLLLVFTTIFPLDSSLAQTQTAGQIWSTPVNLSHSGSTTNPAIVVDSDGIVHVVWEDTIAGEMYTSYDGTQWSTPVPVSLPFGPAPSGGAAQQSGPSNLRLIADSKGYVHAFWVERSNLQSGQSALQLYYSRVLGSQFANGANWDAPQILANSAVDYDVALDIQDHIHLAYVRVLDESGFPPGIYYRQSAVSGASWGNPKVLYQSQYFRSLTVQNANVSIATDRNSAGQNIYIAWDNRPRKQVYYSRSTDGGSNWSDPTEIDKPDTNNGFATPLNIRVATNSLGTLVEWQVGDNAGSCNQIYQWSTDSGSIWSDQHIMLDSLRGCAIENHYFESGDNLFLATTIDAQIYFLAWNGENWSEPRLQTELSGFQDPETSTQVVFDCRSITQGPRDLLYVVGCDTGGGGDIWLTSRSLGDLNTWFSPPSTWSTPVVLTSGVNNFNSVTLLADKSGNFHAFWLQPNITPGITSTVSIIGSPQLIYYSQLKGDQWLPPVTILNSTIKNAGQISASTDEASDLLLAWTEADTGDIRFSWANTGVANISSEWSKPVALPSLGSENASPFILAGGSGKIYVAYAIPLNEDRGIYFTQSNDNGSSWSQPVQIFNGVTAGSQMVDQPKLAITSDGVIHILWNQTSVIGENNSPRLYYSRSLDGGMTWADPTVVVDGATDWDQILGFGNQVQRIWQASENDQTILWLQTSTDGGLNWSQPASFSNFGGNLSIPDLTGSNIQEPNLFFVSNNPSGDQVLKQLIWDGKGWSAQEDFTFTNSPGDVIASLNAAVAATGNLGVLYVEQTFDDTSKRQVINLDFTQRAIQVANLPATPLPNIVPALTQTVTPTATIAVPLTPTPIALPQNLENVIPQSGFMNNSYAGAILGTIIALALVISIFLGVIRATKSKHR